MVQGHFSTLKLLWRSQNHLLIFAVFRWPPPSALMVRTGTTTSSFPRTAICSPSVGAGGWCAWTRRARPGISRTRWWPAALLAPPAQTRAPPTARTQTLPLWTQTTCERTPSAMIRNETGLSSGEWRLHFLGEQLLLAESCTCELWHTRHKYLILCYFCLSFVPLSSRLTWVCTLSTQHL